MQERIFDQRLPAEGAGSLLEVDAWMPSEISAVSPLVERLMRLIEGTHCTRAKNPPSNWRYGKL